MLARAERRADDLADIVRRGVRLDRAGFELGHVEQIGDEAVEPLGFLDDRRKQVGLALGRHSSCARARAASRPRRGSTASGVFRSCEIEVSRAERSRSVSTLRLASSMSSTRWTRSMASARLVDQRIEQAALVGRQQRARLVAVDADDADRAAAGAHRQEQPLGAGQRVGAAPRRRVVLPGPFRGGEIGFVEGVLGRIAGLDRDRAVLRQQQHDPHLQHRGDLVGGRPEHVVERADAGELAAEGVERPRWCAPAPCAVIGLLRTRAARLETTTATRVKKTNGDHVGRVGDREGVDAAAEKKKL